ncbi:hypothetical protein HDU97_001451 [Phlyctochytrium planicorne]|nr:hypothetical protein HDU97_001451 [Phlyctochytrium planicorne]
MASLQNATVPVQIDTGSTVVTHKSAVSRYLAKSGPQTTPKAIKSKDRWQPSPFALQEIHEDGEDIILNPFFDTTVLAKVLSESKGSNQWKASGWEDDIDSLGSLDEVDEDNLSEDSFDAEDFKAKVGSADTEKWQEKPAVKALGKPFFSKLSGIVEGCGNDQKKIEAVKQRKLWTNHKREDEITRFPFDVKKEDINSVNARWERGLSQKVLKDDKINGSHVSFSEITLSASKETPVDLEDIAFSSLQALASHELKETKLAENKPPIVPMDSGFESWTAKLNNPLIDSKDSPRNLSPVSNSVVADAKRQSLPGLRVDNHEKNEFSANIGIGSSKIPFQSSSKTIVEEDEDEDFESDEEADSSEEPSKLHTWILTVGAALREMFKTPAQRRRERKGKAVETPRSSTTLPQKSEDALPGKRKIWSKSKSFLDSIRFRRPEIETDAIQ